MFSNMYGLNASNPRWLWWIVPLALLDVVLKGFALWRSASNKQQVWFIALLIVNSLGILPTIYLLTNPERKSSSKKK